MLAAGSTVPYYGFKLRAFPFAGRRASTMNLRVFTRIPVPAMVLQARKIFTGEFQHPGLLDFEAEQVEMSFDRPVPFQVGGDAEGYRDSLTLGIARRSVELLDYTGRASILPAPATLH